MNTFVSTFNNSLKESNIDYKVVENVVDFKEQNKSLKISDFQGKTFSIAKNTINNLPTREREIDAFVQQWLTTNLKLENNSFDLRTSKDFVSDSVIDRVKNSYKWNSWFVLSNKHLINTNVQGYVFLTASTEKLYFTVIDKEDLKKLVRQKKIAANDRFHLYLGETKKWIFF